LEVLRGFATELVDVDGLLRDLECVEQHERGHRVSRGADSYVDLLSPQVRQLGDASFLVHQDVDLFHVQGHDRDEVGHGALVLGLAAEEEKRVGLGEAQVGLGQRGDDQVAQGAV
jgi:hypothetical protein